MTQTHLVTALVPAALMLIMLALGLSLEVDDFRRVMRTPSSLVGGVTGQLLLLPALGVAVARYSGLEATFAIGIVVLALSPGGALSNAVSAFARADLALSVSLTAVSSLVVPFSLPILYAWATRLWAPAVPALALPVLPTILRLTSVTVVPVAVGMAIRVRFRPTAVRLERTARVLSAVLFFAIVLVIVVENADALRAGLRTLGGPLLVLGAGSTGIGLLMAVLARLPTAGAVTLGIEVGMQNIATATFVTATLLGDSTMALAPAAYAFVMLPLAGTLALVGRGRPRRTGR